MWTCPHCGQEFVKTNQQHSCNDNTLDDFLRGKSEFTIALFWHFARSFQKIGESPTVFAQILGEDGKKPQVAQRTRRTRKAIEAPAAR